MRLDAPCIGLPNALCLAIPRYTDWIAWPIIVSCEMRICSLAGRPARNWMGYCGLILRGEVQLDRMLKTIRVRVRHQNSVFRIFTNFDSRLRIKKFVFLIRIHETFVQKRYFKIRLNIRYLCKTNILIRFDGTLNAALKLGVIAFWNAVCLLLSFLPFHLPNNKSHPTESLVIHGDVCESKLGRKATLFCSEKEGMAGMCFAPAREEFLASLEVNRIVQGATASIKFADWWGIRFLRPAMKVLRSKSLKPGLMLV